MSGVLLERDYKNLAQLGIAPTAESWKRFVQIVNSNSEPIPVANVPLVLTPEITNPVLLLANTEYSIALPANTLKFKFKPRTVCRIRISYVAGETATNYFTVPLGAGFEEEYASLIGGTIYVQSTEANTILEMITYK